MVSHISEIFSYGTPVGTIEPRKINLSSLLLWGIGRHHWEEMSQLWKWKQKKVSKIQCYTVSSHPHYKVICSCSFSFFYENFHFAFFALWRGLQNSPFQISQKNLCTTCCSLLLLLLLKQIMGCSCVIVFILDHIYVIHGGKEIRTVSKMLQLL